MRTIQHFIFPLGDFINLCNDLLVLCPFWDMAISLRRPLWDKPCLIRAYFETYPLSYNNHYETWPFWDMTILRHDTFPTATIMRHDHFETWHFSYINHFETWLFWDMTIMRHEQDFFLKKGPKWPTQTVGFRNWLLFLVGTFIIWKKKWLFWCWLLWAPEVEKKIIGSS